MKEPATAFLLEAPSLCPTLGRRLTTLQRGQERVQVDPTHNHPYPNRGCG